jgi:hypothetical protein
VLASELCPPTNHRIAYPLGAKKRIGGRPANERNSCLRPATLKSNAQRDLIARLATGETVAAQDDLAEAWNVNKGTVSKWVSEWERNGTIPARQQIGRCKTIAPHEALENCGDETSAQ